MKDDIDNLREEKFFIVDNIEDYNDYKILLQNNETIACYKKKNLEIAIELNGQVEIQDKFGREIPLYDENLKNSIANGTFEDKYDVVDNNWLEICYYVKNQYGDYEEVCYENEVYHEIREIGDNKEEIKEQLKQWLEEYIEENQEEEEDL